MTDQITSTEQVKRDSAVDEDGTVHESETRTSTTDVPDQTKAEADALNVEAELEEIADLVVRVRDEVFTLAERIDTLSSPPPTSEPASSSPAPTSESGSKDESEPEPKETVIKSEAEPKRKKRSTGWLF